MTAETMALAMPRTRNLIMEYALEPDDERIDREFDYYCTPSRIKSVPRDDPRRFKRCHKQVVTRMLNDMIHTDEGFEQTFGIFIPAIIDAYPEAEENPLQFLKDQFVSGAIKYSVVIGLSAGITNDPGFNVPLDVPYAYDHQYPTAYAMDPSRFRFKPAAPLRNYILTANVGFSRADDQDIGTYRQIIQTTYNFTALQSTITSYTNTGTLNYNGETRFLAFEPTIAAFRDSLEEAEQDEDIEITRFMIPTLLRFRKFVQFMIHVQNEGTY